MDNRYFFEKENQKNDEIILVGQEAQHLSKVRRAKVGDEIIAFNGNGMDYLCQITDITKNNVVCRVLKSSQNKAFEKQNITFFLANIKNEPLTELIDQFTQLNLKHLYLFTSDYTNVKFDDKKIEKLKNRSIQACKQCERAEWLDINLCAFDEMVKMLGDYDLVLFCYENCNNSTFDITYLKDYKDKKIAIIVGCEGGFSSKEVEALKKYAKTISLGKTILRAETASVAILSSVLCNMGAWN